MLEINKIYNEDCLIGMQSIDDKSVDCIICDLPYGNTITKWDKFVNSKKLWKEYERIIKPNHPIILFSSQPYTTKLISSNQKWFKYCWYWAKNQATNFFHAKRMPLRKIEEICVFYKGKGSYNPQKIYDSTLVDTLPKKSTKGKQKDLFRFPNNLLEFNCVSNYDRKHPNEKPIELLEYLIKTYSNENDLILDNCIGCGTTGVAALHTGRNFIGFETDKSYFDIATQRIEELKSQEKLW